MNPETSPEQTPAVATDSANGFHQDVELSTGNPLLAVLGGLLAASFGAAIWAFVTVLTRYQIGWMAVGVGFLVGFSVRYLGKGSTNLYCVIGAVCALLGCVGGNLLSIYGFVAEQGSVSFLQALSLVPVEELPSIMAESFNAMDLLFYGIAVYEGYRFSIPRD